MKTISLLTLRHGMIIGRSPEADFTFNEPSISRRHLEITNLSPGWKVTDLGSRSGTYLNSRLILSARLRLPKGIPAAERRQLVALIGTSLAAVAIGLAISGWARSVLQAVMLVPLILIPQILFSGFTPAAGEMKSRPYFISTLMPSASERQVMDVSQLWNQTISGRLL